MWEGFSDVTKQTLEMAARRRSTPWEVMQGNREHMAVSNALVKALEKSASPSVPTRYTYEEFKHEHGDLIFGGAQPKRALDAVKDRLSEDGDVLKTGSVKKNGLSCKGFTIQRVNDVEPEQVDILD